VRGHSSPRPIQAATVKRGSDSRKTGDCDCGGQTALGLEAKASGEQLWCGRLVLILDGSSESKPDTKVNQSAYPQHSNQAPGCGFPIAKLLVMFSLATGAAMGVLIDALNTSDVTLARRLYSTLKPGDVACSDRAFGTDRGLSFGPFPTSRCRGAPTSEPLIVTFDAARS